MKVLVTGSRYYEDYEVIRTAMERLPKDTIVIHGDAPGADSLTRRIIQAIGLQQVKVPANWKRYGKAAGVLRNQLMIDLFPDIEKIIWFHEDIDNSKGTKDMLRRAEQLGIAIEKGG